MAGEGFYIWPLAKKYGNQCNRAPRARVLKITVAQQKSEKKMHIDLHFLVSLHHPVYMHTRVMASWGILKRRKEKKKERNIIAHIKLYSLVLLSLLVNKASLMRVYYPK